MATRPATAPEAAPRVVGLPRTIHSVPTHARVAAQVARCVAVKAEEAREAFSAYLISCPAAQSVIGCINIKDDIVIDETKS